MTNAQFSLKKAPEADIPVIISLARQVWPQTYTPILGAEQVAYMMALFYSPEALREQMESGHSFFVCRDGTTPIAFASYAAADASVCKLHKLYVLPQAQGCGAGSFIIRYLCGELRTMKARTLLLNVNRYNKNAIAFYEKMGFEKRHEEDIDIGGGYYMNDYVLALAL